MRYEGGEGSLGVFPPSKCGNYVYDWPLTGLVLTKLDGTAKGGVAFALAKQSGLPIQFIGVGEQAEDLRPFEPRSFVAALLGAEAP